MKCQSVAVFDGESDLMKDVSSLMQDAVNKQIA